MRDRAEEEEALQADDRCLLRDSAKVGAVSAWATHGREDTRAVVDGADALALGALDNARLALSRVKELNNRKRANALSIVQRLVDSKSAAAAARKPATLSS